MFETTTMKRTLKKISFGSLLWLISVSLQGQISSATILGYYPVPKNQNILRVQNAWDPNLSPRLFSFSNPLPDKPAFGNENYTFAIYQSFVLPDDEGFHLFPMLGLEYGLNMDDKIQRAYVCLASTYSPGLGKYAGYRAITLKAGIRRGWLEANYGVYLFKATYREIPPFAFQLGLRTPNRNSKMFFRIGIGAPEIVYGGIGYSFKHKNRSQLQK